jgi:hypothetical protein
MSRRFPFYPEDIPSELKHRQQFVNWKAIEKPDATPESELDALACVYHFVLKRHAARAAAAGSCRLRPEGGVNGSLTKGPDEDIGSSLTE